MQSRMKARQRFTKDVVTAIREGKILGIRAGTSSQGAGSGQR